MEENTILLSLESYNDLRDFKKQIESGNTCRVYVKGWSYEVSYVSTDDAIKEMSQKLEALQKENQELKIQPSIEEIKAMSLWRFMKWKAGRIFI